MMLTDSAFVITHVFNAPRAKVWDAWTKADQLATWWGPKGFKVGVKKLDFQEGGVFHYSMQPPGGQDMWGIFTYRDIVPQEKIVFISGFSDKEAKLTRNPWIETWPMEMLNTLQFEDAGNGKTKMTMTAVSYKASAEEDQTFKQNRPSMQKGWAGTLEQLDAFLAGTK